MENEQQQYPNDQQQQPTQRVRVGGFWKKVSKKDGTRFLNGPLTATSQYMLFPNDKKSKDSDPDFILYLYSRTKREQPQQGDDFIAGPAPAQEQPVQQQQMYQQQQPPVQQQQVPQQVAQQVPQQNYAPRQQLPPNDQQAPAVQNPQQSQNLDDIPF